VVKIGVLGGTFDPIHNGHLKVATTVREKLSLDEVIFVPAGQPWQKADRHVSPVEDRLEMVRLAVDGRPGYGLSTVEASRPGNTYSLETLAEIGDQLGSGDELYFVLGWDSLAQFPGWYAPERIMRLCRLVAVPRPGYPRPDVSAMEEALPGITERVVLLDEPQIDLSASRIRERVAAGQPIGDLVPAAVAAYIEEHRLYRR
jgi:nicotinate-nucleotide adenylyltransferase